MPATLERLRARGYRFLASVHGLDYFPEEPRLGVHYELLDMSAVDRISVRTRVTSPSRTVPSVTPEWPTADHQEREIYDMFGVIFEGHPDLRRILMPEDYEGHPQRRDFPVGGEPVLFTYNEPTTPGWWEVIAMSDLTPTTDTPHIPYREMEDSHELSTIEHEHDELLTLNMGPHHPATHGVLRLLTTLEGEVVRDITPIVGYVHTGIEKTAEDKAYWKVIPVVERMDYLSYYFNAMALCGAVERLLDLEVPPRGAVPARHPPRAQPHRLAPDLAGHRRARPRRDVGVLVRLARPRPDPRPLRDVLRPAHAHALHPGRRRDGGHPAGFEAKVRKFTAGFPARMDQYEQLIDQNEIVLQRLRGVGAVDEQTLLDLGVTGPLLRATGNPWDLRKAAPYSSYDHFDFKIPVGTVGDNYDRYRVRMAEMRESVKIIDQALDGLPEGPVHHPDRKYALPPRHELATSMEALIHHFKLVTEGFRVPPGEVYYPIESPRGELACFVRADGSAKPARVHMRDPSFVNLQAFKPMVAGPLRRRPDRRAGDARPDPRGHRPLMAIDPSRVRRYAHGSRVPGWDEAADLTKDPAVVPDPATTPVPAEVRAEIEAHMAQVPRPALGRDPRADGGPGPLRLVLADRDRAGRVRDAPDAGLPHRGGDVLRHVRDRAARASTPSTCARTSPARCAAPTRSTTRCSAPPATTRASTCAPSSASARATSRRWRRSTASTSGRSTPRTAARSSTTARPAGRCSSPSSCGTASAAGTEAEGRVP